MVKVFKIRVEANKCQWIIPDDEEFTKQGNLRFDGSLKLNNWNPPKFYIQKPTQEKSNFFIINVGTLAFDQSVMDNPMMAMFFEKAGEILPIELETGEPLYLLNTTEIINALDIERSEYRVNPRTGAKVKLVKHVFKPDRFTQSSIFKIPETKTGEVLTFDSHFSNPLDEFYSNYRESGFTGLKFEEVWSEDKQ